MGMWCNPLRPCHCDRDEWEPVRLIVAGPVVFACSWLALTTSPVFWIGAVAAAVFARNGWRVAGALAMGVSAGFVNAAYPTDVGMALAFMAAAVAALIVVLVYCVVTEGAPELDQLLALVRRPVPTPPPAASTLFLAPPVVESVTVTETTTTTTIRYHQPDRPAQLPVDVGWIDADSQLVERAQLEHARRQLTPPPAD